MVMNLDKCIGCHTCSIPCKNVWTNRKGAEYIWYNNVETKPGIGYPKRWENQKEWKGGWAVKNGKLTLLAGSRAAKLAKIFHNPNLPLIDDYYEPWTYNYEDLTTSPPRKHQPALRPKSLITGDNLRLKWGPNWEDDLAGVNKTGLDDVNFDGMEREAYLNFKNVFMFHLPRICEHCLNPSCLGSCPSGAIYKRDEDGIVLIDQERCRGWRFCASGCPYKKAYFNWSNGRSEKCIFCHPRIEAGMPTLCAETCVGRIRYIGVVLYDADQIGAAASTADLKDLYLAQTALFLNPNDPKIASEASKSGIPEGVIEAARRSPIYKLAVEWKLALPPHPEFRTLPMVWYIPPLSPIVGSPEPEGKTTVASIDRMRIPVKYLANLLAAGDERPVRLALRRLAALRDYMRSVRVRKSPDVGLLEEVGLTPATADAMYSLLAVAKYTDRYVIPTMREEGELNLHREQGHSGYPDAT
jgi:nitrate reductase beta subunit